MEGGLLNYIREHGDGSTIEREATAGAHGSTTAMPTKTTKVTDMPGDKPRPLTRAEEFDLRVVERAAIDAATHDQFGHGLPGKTDTRLASKIEDYRLKIGKSNLQSSIYNLQSSMEGATCLDVATSTGNLAVAF